MSDEPEDIDDGGPAFPVVSQNYRVHGMTLRDWFVGQALAGGCGISQPSHVITTDYVEAAYDIADEVLRRRPL